jgi:hypothetical protein
MGFAVSAQGCTVVHSGARWSPLGLLALARQRRSARALGRKRAPQAEEDTLDRMKHAATRDKGNHMVDVTIVYWRDIPAQVIVGKGRSSAKKQLPEKFEQAIDRAAMKTGAAGSDAYLAEWRKAAPYPVDGAAEDVVTAEAARLDADYDRDRLKALIANDGWDSDHPSSDQKTGDA